MKNVGYYNGKIGPLEDMMIPMNDRAVYFGDGCYDATLCANHIPFALEDHLDRFYNSLRLLEIPFTMSREELTAELMKVMDAADDDELMLYWQCSRGTGFRDHVFPAPEVKPNLLIYARPYSIVPMDRTLKLITIEDTRFLHCNIKTLNLIPSVIANQRAKEAGCDEAIFHRGDIVTECAHSNILILQNGVLRSHPADNLILPGITRKHLLELAKENGIPTNEDPFTLAELMAADEVIMTSSGALCNQVVEVDGKPVGGKAPEQLKTLQDAYTKKFKAYTKQL